MKNLTWSCFQWFNKKKRIKIDKFSIACSTSKGKDEKIIFPLKNLKKHLTFSNSKRKLDFHATDDDKRNSHRPIFKISKNKAYKIVKNQVKLGHVAVRVIPFGDKELKRILVADPTSLNFFQYSSRMYDGNILPYYLNKIRARKEDNTHRKILFAFSKTGEFRGMMKCNHRKNGFEFVSCSPIQKIKKKIINMNDVKKRLLEEGLTESNRAEITWKSWEKFLIFCRHVKLKILG